MFVEMLVFFDQGVRKNPGQPLTNRSKQRRMARKTFIVVWLVVLALAQFRPAEAQHAKKVHRIGYLTSNTSSAELPRLDAFRQALRDLGHVEGQNITIEHRHAEGKFDRLPGFAAELVGLKVDVLVGVTTNAVQAAKKATRTIPIVFIGVSDPVAAEFVDSLARPGGNLTGFTNIAPVLSGKRLELLKETIPKLSRVAVLWDPQSPGSVPQWKETELAATELGLQLYSMQASSVDEYEGAFKNAVKARSGALAVTLNPVSNSNQKTIADLAMKNRLPTMCARGDYVDNGCMMSYGPSYVAEGRDAARYVDKILKGTKPADLPVEQPMKFELVINLKTAKQIGLAVPPSVLYRADRMIK
jgi:putative tryptophan/tyrosine transport system substrate-binding protein